MSQQAPEKKSVVGAAVVVAILLIVATLGVVYWGGGENGPGGNGSALTEHLKLTRTALAATENMDPADAEQYWGPLLKDYPNDRSVALNLALNRVLLVDVLSGEATNTLKTDAEKKAAREKLPDAIAGARSGVEQYAKIADDPITSLWLRSRVDLHEAALLPAAMTRSLRRGIYDRLIEALASDLGKSAQSIILGGPLTQVLDEMEHPIDGLPADLMTTSTKSISAMSDQHPDNLFLALRAARLNIETKNKDAETYVSRTAELARAIDPLLNEMTKPIGMTPSDLVNEISKGIESENWNEALNRMLQWFNVLNPTEILKTDRRRVSPHPLDRLSFDSLRRLSAEALKAEPVEQGAGKIAFASTTVDGTNNIAAIQTIDFDLDLDPDLAAITSDGQIQLWSNNPDGWQQAGEIKLDIKPTGLLVADLYMVDSSAPGRIKTESETTAVTDADYSTATRHNTFPGLIAFGDDGLRLIALDGRRSTADDQRLKTIEKPSGLADVTAVTDVATGDLEGDGDLDLIVATQTAGVRLFINRGNRTFFETTHHQGGFDPTDPVTSMVAADIDRDLDLDVVTLHGASGRIGILENLLHLQFRGRFIDEIPAIKAADSIAVEDVDGNVSWDVVVAGGQGTSVVFSQTADAGLWTVERIETDDTPMRSATVADVDNDSWSELISLGADGTSMVRLGPWGVTAEAKIDSLTSSVAGNTLADFNGDGLIDLAGIDGGKLNIAINKTASPGHHVDIRFKGIADNAANSGRVNHYAIGSVLELRFGPHYRSKIVSSPVTHFGIDGYDTVGSVRAIFPNGLTQTIREPAIDMVIEEEQSLKGSCPYLYAWDGDKFVFKTDCLWAAPLGLQVARGVVAKDRPWEYLKIDGDDVKPRDDGYEFRITEELWEVAYIEQVGLATIDHPANVQVYTNEKVGPAEIATPTVFAFRDADLREVVMAVDTKGREVTEQLKHRDRDFVQGFDRRLRQGLCPPHWIDVSFGDLAIAERAKSKPSVYLVLTGWILPTDTSLNIQIDQNPELPAIEFPSVWVPDASESGGWRKAIPFMGFPGGKTKTIVVDVTNVINHGDPQLRIRTSAQIYWDDARLAVQTEPAPFKQQTTALQSAEMAYHGFSLRTKDGPRQPEWYDYTQTTMSPRWPPLRGSLTQFGRCDDLIQAWDDRMVVMSGGDELRMRFSLPETPAPKGWKRDFVLHCVGWDKDADLNTLAGQTTYPLPYRSMGEYPPTTANMAELQSVERKNRFHLQRHQSFRAFWHRGDAPPARRFLPAYSPTASAAEKR